MRYLGYHETQQRYSKMTKDSVPATAAGMPKFTRSDIMSKAWADYRRDEFKGYCGPRRGEGFNRKHFAYCLRMVWAVAKERVARAAAELAPVPVARPCTNPFRAVEIRAELHDMEMGDFIPWARRLALQAELSRLS
jgi:hypothetical protein